MPPWNEKCPRGTKNAHVEQHFDPWKIVENNYWPGGDAVEQKKTVHKIVVPMKIVENHLFSNEIGWGAAPWRRAADFGGGEGERG